LKHAATTTKTKVAKKVRTKLKTIGAANVNHLLCYHNITAWVTKSAFYSNSIMQGGSVVTSNSTVTVAYIKGKLNVFLFVVIKPKNILNYVVARNLSVDLV